MLGRSVAEEIERTGRAPFDDDVVAIANEADLFVLNLECCISARGERWPAAGKPFFFRAPPLAAELLASIGVDCVTLANNHALDYGAEALLDTLEHLANGRRRLRRSRPGPSRRASAAHHHGGRASPHDHRRRRPSARLRGGGRPARHRVRRPPARRARGWLADAVAEPREDPVLVACHWGPNMTVRPPRLHQGRGGGARRRRRDARRRPLRPRLPRRRRPRPLRPRRLRRRLRGRQAAAQRSRPAVPRRAGHARTAHARSRPAQARLLPHPTGTRRRREMDRPPVHGGVRRARDRGHRERGAPSRRPSSR